MGTVAQNAAMWPGRAYPLGARYDGAGTKPVHQFVTDAILVERGLTNYWGDNTIGFFAPHNGYCSSGTRCLMAR
jgi:hypothetical protein